MKIQRPPYSGKLCHAKPGDVVEVSKNLYIVCVDSPKSKDSVTNGLYSEDGQMFLVDLATGRPCRMPHLSSKVILRPDAVVMTGREEPKDASAKDD